MTSCKVLNCFGTR